MNQSLLRIAGAALVIASPGLYGRDRTPAKTPPPKEENTVPASVPPYVLKNRSKFDEPAATARVPFWPVGWTKQKQIAAVAVAAVAEPKMTLDEKSFRVTSILVGSGTTPSLAVINERPYGEGEFVRMPRGSGARARIRVERINDGYVSLSYEGQKIRVPLLRQELNQHKPEDEFLDPNR